MTLIYGVSKEYIRRIGHWYTAYASGHCGSAGNGFFVVDLRECVLFFCVFGSAGNGLYAVQKKRRWYAACTPYINILYALYTLYIRRKSTSYTPYIRLVSITLNDTNYTEDLPETVGYAVYQCPIRLVYALHCTSYIRRVSNDTNNTQNTFCMRTLIYAVYQTTLTTLWRHTHTLTHTHTHTLTHTYTVGVVSTVWGGVGWGGGGGAYTHAPFRFEGWTSTRYR